MSQEATKLKLTDEDDNFESAGKMSRCKELAYQMGMLALCYTAWMFVHM